MTASTAAGEAAGVPLRSTAGRFGTVARDLIVVGLVAGIGLVAVVGYTTFRIWQIGATDGARPAGAIVVLGAAQYDGRPSPVFEARLEHAVDLWQAGLAPLLVMTGGKQPGDRVTEAEAGRDYALSRGVPESAIVVEPASRSTLASVEAVRELLARRGVDDAVFVSDPTHMLRVLRMAGDAGFQAYGSPTRTSPAEVRLEPRLRSMVHELGALALYFIAGQAPSGESTAD
jgi:uncharacterized SAM-binding protein YcdF (DUF218 family)